MSQVGLWKTAEPPKIKPKRRAGPGQKWLPLEKTHLIISMHVVLDDDVAFASICYDDDGDEVTSARMFSTMGKKKMRQDGEGTSRDPNGSLNKTGEVCGDTMLSFAAELNFSYDMEMECAGTWEEENQEAGVGEDNTGRQLQNAQGDSEVGPNQPRQEP
ncbi:hypothetical protein RND81_11G160100 [Saponaria officinalis]|uniref:Uncharacterized protein n=1 Tax=Saponaria officinalis TaxID=3572 RepID=A0AAW1HMS4_SAPOF